jgi:hypothetical protein
MNFIQFANFFVVDADSPPFVPVEKNVSSPLFRIITKTILSGSAAYIIFGPQIAALSSSISFSPP